MPHLERVSVFMWDFDFITEDGSDISSFMISAFLDGTKMVPQLRKKAQEEIDSVVMEDQSPRWPHFAQLPNESQIVEETMRWRHLFRLSFLVF